MIINVLKKRVELFFAEKFKKKKRKLHLMRHFTAVGKNRLANSSDLSFDLDSAILCYLGPGHLTSLSVVFLSCIC